LVKPPAWCYVSYKINNWQNTADSSPFYSIPKEVRVSQTILHTCLVSRYPYQRFTHAPLSCTVNKAAQCLTFGATLLVALPFKGGEALLASSMCFGGSLGLLRFFGLPKHMYSTNNQAA